MNETATDDLTIRRLGDTDAEALARAAQLDTAPVPSGATIGAFDPSTGALLAAISLETGELVADPFVSSEHAATLLRVRARQIAPAAQNGRGGRLRRARWPRARAESSPRPSPGHGAPAAS